MKAGRRRGKQVKMEEVKVMEQMEQEAQVVAKMEMAKLLEMEMELEAGVLLLEVSLHLFSSLAPAAWGEYQFCPNSD